MSSEPLNDKEIVNSWVKNASSWTTAVREGLIESRRLCTDQAIVDAVLTDAPKTAIDLGCGEGWLTRELTKHGLDVIGIDAAPDFIEEARRAGEGDFRLLSYEDFEAGKTQ